jgi:hypothetical protein
MSVTQKDKAEALGRKVLQRFTSEDFPCPPAEYSMEPEGSFRRGNRRSHPDARLPPEWIKLRYARFARPGPRSVKRCGLCTSNA